MKKITCWVLLFAILLSISGCGANTPSNTTESSDNTTQSATQPTVNITTATQPVISDHIPNQAPMTAISLPVSVSNSYSEDDVLLFTYKCQTMSLIVPDNEIESKVILDFQTRLDHFSSAAQEINDQAKADFASSADWTPYSYNVLYTPTRIDLAVLSLFGSNVSLTSGAHPTRNCTSANYDLITGDVLTLGSILTHQDSLGELCELLIAEVAEIKAEKFIMSNYEDIIRNRFSQNESYNEAWYFNSEGINFYFSPYEIAPYSSGIITVTIPYDKLTGIIEDRYFPAEKDIATGTLTASRHGDADIESFTQIAEVVLDKDGEMVFLYTDRSVQNVIIEYGFWDVNGTVFTAESTVFATPILTPGDAAMVQASISDTMPNIRVTYSTQNKTIVEYISQNVQDGTILLIPESSI